MDISGRFKRRLKSFLIWFFNLKKCETCSIYEWKNKLRIVYLDDPDSHLQDKREICPSCHKELTNYDAASDKENKKGF